MKKITKLFAVTAFLFSTQFANAQEPTVAAPTPVYPAADVISIYGATYTSALTNLKFQTNWYTKGETTTVTDIEIGDDAAMKITDLQWASFELKPEIKFRDYNYVHVDVFSNEDAEFCVGFQNWVPGQEVYSPVVNVTAGKWNSFDFLLSGIFAENAGMNANVLRFNKDVKKDANDNVIDAGTKFAKEVYVSNFYVYKGEPATGINHAKAEMSFSIYPTQVTDNLYFASEEAIDVVDVYSITGQSAGTYKMAGQNQINLSSLQVGSYIVFAKLANGEAISKHIIKL